MERPDCVQARELSIPPRSGTHMGRTLPERMPCAWRRVCGLKGRGAGQATQGRRACRESHGVFRAGLERLKRSPQRLGYPRRRLSQSHVDQNRRASALNGVRYVHRGIMHAHQSSAHARGRQRVRWRLGACSSSMGAHMNTLSRGHRGSKRLSGNASRLMHLPGVGYGRGKGERSANRWPLLKTEGASGEVIRAAFKRHIAAHLDAVRLQPPTQAVEEY